MKKKVLALVLATAMTASLAACGGGNEPAAPADGTAIAPQSMTSASARVKIRFIGVLLDVDAVSPRERGSRGKSDTFAPEKPRSGFSKGHARKRGNF